MEGSQESAGAPADNPYVGGAMEGKGREGQSRVQVPKPLVKPRNAEFHDLNDPGDSLPGESK